MQFLNSNYSSPFFWFSAFFLKQGDNVHIYALLVVNVITYLDTLKQSCGLTFANLQQAMGYSRCFCYVLFIFNPFSMFFDKSLMKRAIGAPSITSWSKRIDMLSISLISILSSITDGFFITELIPKHTG